MIFQKFHEPCGNPGKNNQSVRESYKYLVQLAHGGGGRGNDVVYEEEKSIFSSQVDSFSDEKVKLAH